MSSQPGTTRDTIRHEINFKKNTVTFYDTAGLRSTDDEIESEGIGLTKKAILKSSIVLYVVDDTHGFDKADKQMIKDNNINDYWVINNKIDKTNKSPLHTTENNINWYCFHASCKARGKKEGEKNMQYVEKVLKGNQELYIENEEFKIWSSW